MATPTSGSRRSYALALTALMLVTAVGTIGGCGSRTAEEERAVLESDREVELAATAVAQGASKADAKATAKALAKTDPTMVALNQPEPTRTPDPDRREIPLGDMWLHIPPSSSAPAPTAAPTAAGAQRADVSLSVDAAGPCTPATPLNTGGALTVTPSRRPAGWSLEGVLQDQWRIAGHQLDPTPLLFITRESDYLDDGAGAGPYRMISSVIVAGAKGTAADFCAGALALFGPIGAMQPTTTTIGGLRVLRVQFSTQYGPNDQRAASYYFVPIATAQGAVIFTTRTYSPEQGRTPQALALGQAMDSEADAIIQGLVFQVNGKALP